MAPNPVNSYGKWTLIAPNPIHSNRLWTSMAHPPMNSYGFVTTIASVCRLLLKLHIIGRCSIWGLVWQSWFRIGSPWVLGPRMASLPMNSWGLRPWMAQYECIGFQTIDVQFAYEFSFGTSLLALVPNSRFKPRKPIYIYIYIYRPWLEQTSFTNLWVVW